MLMYLKLICSGTIGPCMHNLYKFLPFLDLIRDGIFVFVITLRMFGEVVVVVHVWVTSVILVLETNNGSHSRGCWFYLAIAILIMPCLSTVSPSNAPSNAAENQQHNNNWEGTTPFP